jgi:hypothetical protein
MQRMTIESGFESFAGAAELTLTSRSSVLTHSFASSLVFRDGKTRAPRVNKFLCVLIAR